jgi:hypothetical protein
MEEIKEHESHATASRVDPLVRPLVEKPPNPGSAEAQQLGCKCAVMDNAYGRGCGYQDENGNPMFWITEGCPLHAAV